MSDQSPNKIRKSEQYGEVIYTHIATFSFFPPKMGNLTVRELNDVANRAVNWISKFHPKHFFHSYILESTRPDLPYKEQEAFPFKLFVPTITDNQDWVKNNKDCNYMKQINTAAAKRIKKIPIGITDTDIQKWLIATEKENLLIAAHV
jgi:hypothetical protein